MHSGLAPGLSWCFHGDRSTGFSPLPVVLRKIPFGYSASVGTENLSPVPTASHMYMKCICMHVTVSWWTQSEFCVSQWMMDFRLIWSLSVIAWQEGIVWEVEWRRSAVAMAPAHCAQWAWKIATWGFAFSLSLYFLFSLYRSVDVLWSHTTLQSFNELYSHIHTVYFTEDEWETMLSSGSPNQPFFLELFIL